MNDSIMFFPQKDSLFYNGISLLRPELIELRSEKLSGGFEGLPIRAAQMSENWVFGVVLFLFFLFCFLKSSNRDFTFEKIKFFYRTKGSQIFISQNFGKIWHIFPMLNILFFSSVFSLFVYLNIVDYGEPLVFSVYALFLLCTLLFLFFKFISARFLFFVFFDKNIFVFAFKIIDFSIFLLSALLFPFLFLLLYIGAEYVVFVKIIVSFVLVIWYVFFVARTFSVFFRKKADVFYILLYLCTLEFIPVLLLFELYKLIA